MTAQEQLNALLAHYGQAIHTPLALKNGVCALVDERQQEVLVIELPPESDTVLLHCTIEGLKGATTEKHLRTLLALNFEMNAMRGSWLALDGDETVRLCSQCPVNTLDAASFTQWLNGFMIQAQEVRDFLEEIRTAA